MATTTMTTKTKATDLAAQRDAADQRRDRARAAVSEREGDLTRLEALMLGSDQVERIRARLASAEALRMLEEARLELAEADREAARLHDTYRENLHEPLRRRLQAAYGRLLEKARTLEPDAREVLILHEEAQAVGLAVTPGVPGPLTPAGIERWGEFLAREGLIVRDPD